MVVPNQTISKVPDVSDMINSLDLMEAEQSTDTETTTPTDDTMGEDPRNDRVFKYQFSLVVEDNIVETATATTASSSLLQTTSSVDRTTSKKRQPQQSGTHFFSRPNMTVVHRSAICFGECFFEQRRVDDRRARELFDLLVN